jgi:hypothetical protein
MPQGRPSSARPNPQYHSDLTPTPTFPDAWHVGCEGDGGTAPIDTTHEEELWRSSGLSLW